MPKFISDADMEKISAKEPKRPGFISDADMEKVSPNWSDVSLEGLKEGAIESIPLAGGVAGGALGLLLGGPPGAMLGAGIGGGTGQYIKQAIRPPKIESEGLIASQLEMAKEPLREGLLMGIGEGLPGIAVKGLTKAGGLVSKAKRAVLGGKEMPSNVVPEAEAIKQASRNLGVPTTPAQVTSQPVIKGMQSSLEQSPTIAGQQVRKQTGEIYEGLGKAAEEVVSGGSQKTNYELGDQVKKELIEGIRLKNEPLAKSYEEIALSTQHIPLNEKSIQRVAKNIEQLKSANIIKGSPEQSEAFKIAESLRGAKSVNDIKLIKTYVGKQARAAFDNRNPTLGQSLSEISERLGRLQENSTMRAAIEQAQTKTQGKNIGKGLIGQVKETNASYRKLMTDLKEFADRTGVTNTKNLTPSQLMDAIEDVPSEKIGEKLFTSGDIDTLKFVQKNHQNQFELIKQQKISQITEKATTAKNKLDTNKLIKIVDSYEPEVVQMLFGESKVNLLKDMKTVAASLPEKMGPSGTPQGLEFSRYLNPKQFLDELTRARQLRKIKKSVIVKEPRLDSKAPKLRGPIGQGLLQNIGDDDDAR